MRIQIIDGQRLRATLCEIERGLFYVAYNVDGLGLGAHPLPRYEVGTSVADAKRRVEQRARECGFQTVTWESELADCGTLPSPAQEAAASEAD